MSGFEIQYLNSFVYEVRVDDATGKTGSLMKQTNNAIPVVGYQIERRYDVSYNQLVEEFTEKFKDSDEPLWLMRGYPLGVVYDGDCAEGGQDHIVTYDQVCNYTIAYGWCTEQRKHKPTEPILIKGDTSPEAITKAREEALQPYIVVRPFLLVFPESNKYMFEIRVSHVVDGAVYHWDSSKVEKAPEYDDAIEYDENSPHFTDEQLAKRKQIQEAIDRVAAKGKFTCDRQAICTELNADWASDIDTFNKVLSELRMPIPAEEPITPIEPTGDVVEQVAIVQKCIQEEMDASGDHTVYLDNVIKRLKDQGHDWFDTRYELDRFVRTYIRRDPPPVSAEERQRMAETQRVAETAIPAIVTTTKTEE